MSTGLTPRDVIAISFLGAMFALLGLIVLAATAAGIYAATHRLIDHLEVRRTRRRDLAACRAINALGTTNEPTQE